MRNREFAWYLGISLAIGAAGTAAGFALGTRAGFLCLGLAVLLVGVGAAFSGWRYREIRRLSAALSRAAADGTVLDLRTNREGELSILQNDLYKITAALAGQAEHLQQDKLFLSGVLGDISHQIKTPLTSLLVHSDLLQDDNLPPEKRKEFLARISSQLERIRWLVGSLLKLSRVDAAVVEFRREEIPLHRLISRAVEPLLPLAERRGVQLEVDCRRELAWTGDAEWTTEALGNLVKNCVEHAGENGHVAVRCVDNPLQTQIMVEDDGPGFARQDLPRLFERFYRGERAGDEGVGIGLAMARTILRAQHADVAAENREEGGARFVVKLYKNAGEFLGAPGKSEEKPSQSV